LLLASAANLSATITSEARKSWTPFSAAIFSSLRANSSCRREIEERRDEVRDFREGGVRDCRREQVSLEELRGRRSRCRVMTERRDEREENM
jgi:hypothetical protein